MMEAIEAKEQMYQNVLERVNTGHQRELDRTQQEITHARRRADIMTVQQELLQKVGASGAEKIAEAQKVTCT